MPSQWRSIIRANFFIGSEPLPLQGGLPVIEELSGPSLGAVVPELTELLLEHVGRIESLVGSQERLQEVNSWGQSYTIHFTPLWPV